MGDVRPENVVCCAEVVNMLRDALELLAEDNSKRENHTGPYAIEGGKIAWRKQLRDGVVSVPLCNFSARIVKEVLVDDGAEQRLSFLIEGRLATGEPLPRVAVPAERFASMSWVVEAWGSRAVVSAGQGAKDRLREALQVLSGDVPRRTVYGHLGWRRVGDRWVFLHAGGAIGAEGAVAGIECDPGPALEAYRLPAPPEGERLREAVRASLWLLDVAPAAVAWPLLAAVYRAPLAEALPVDFSIHLAGPTGAGKSTLAGLVQAHYGAGFGRLHLPASWSATGNALERMAFLAKDAVLVVDDFAPRGGQRDVEALHREADRLLRAAGNRAGRQRLAPDGTLRPVYYPRGLVVSTGEDVPAGQSLRARLLVVEVGPGVVSWSAVQELQEAAAVEVLAEAVAGYVRWLAPQLDELREELRARHRALREEARRRLVGAHPRTPDAVANLMLGAETLLRFAAEAGAFAVDEAEPLREEAWGALLEVGAAQAENIRAEDPCERFIEILRSALLDGPAYVADARFGRSPEHETGLAWPIITGDWPPAGWRKIGWTNGEELLLDPHTAYALVQEQARRAGHPLPVGERTLWKRLAERGLLRRDGVHLTAVRVVERMRRRVLVMPLRAVIPEPEPLQPLGPAQ